VNYNILFDYDCSTKAGSLFGIYTAEAPHVEVCVSLGVQSTMAMGV
jgi:hypothetical protein